MAERKFSATEHAWVEERLSAYIDNQLAPLERAQLERHLRDCARCQASLASLRWTVSLVKQAPAPALPRAFTLPMPAPVRHAPAFGFGFARLATVAATLLLFAVIGVDAISQLGGGFAASAPAPAALQSAAQLTSIALVPTSAADKSLAVPPTVAPAAVPPVATSVPSPTEVFGRGGGAPETLATDSAKSGVTTLTAPRAPAVAPRESITATRAASAAILATQTLPTATATATVPSPTATAQSSSTPNVQVRVQPTVAPAPPRANETPQQIVTPLRLGEIGLLFLAAFFGTLTVMLRRR
jgi:Putative zinc-finger